MPQFLDSTGKIVLLGRQIGRGGEGAVYEIADNPALVAKIYHEPISDDKAEKLRQIVALKNEKLLKLSAWVVETLHIEPHGKIAGFLMPRLKSGTAIHELYTPKSRRQHFPEADWRFLIAAAANLARAFAVIHAHNHAVGDVNHGNVVIARDATVRLIDCDSYHLNAPEKQFLCEVGVSTHTPPELQGQSLRDVARTANHDNFGLAVLIFQLLFMGRHPFSGSFLGDGENTLENSIKARRFAYGEGAASRQMKQPPGTLPLRAVSLRVAKLFEGAFMSIENRPTAREWVEALEELSENLQNCEANNGHYYLKDLQKCAWCALEGKTGVLFFPAKFTGNFGANGEFDVVTIGNLIDAIKPPEMPEQLAIKTQLQLAPMTSLPPSPKLKTALSDYRKKLALYLIGVAVAIFLVVVFGGFGYVVQLCVGVLAICAGIWNSLTKEIREQTQLTVDVARRKWFDFKDQWNKGALLKPFEMTRDSLKTAAKEYQNLAARKVAKLKELENGRHERQLEIFLKTFPISRAKVAGLDEERLEMLRSNGIRTAAHINGQAFAAIPNFSYLHKKRLFDWRAGLEKKFVSKSSISQMEIDEIENEIAETRLRLEAELKSGLPRLQQVALHISRKYQELTVQSERLAAEFSQAESDFQRVSKLQQHAIAWTVGVALMAFSIGIPIRFMTFEKTQPYYRNTTKISASKASGIGGGQGAGNGAPYTPNITAPKEWGEAGEFYKNGEKYLLDGKYDLAVYAFEQAIKLNPNIAQIQRKYADTLQILGRNRDAINAYQKAVSLNPADSDSFYMMGITYAKMNRTNDTVKSFKKAIELNPDATMPHYELGLTLKKASRQAEAVNHFKKAIESSKGFIEAHYEMALCYAALGKTSLAMDEYNFIKETDSALARQLLNEIEPNGDGYVPSVVTRPMISMPVGKN